METSKRSTQTYNRNRTHLDLLYEYLNVVFHFLGDWRNHEVKEEEYLIRPEGDFW